MYAIRISRREESKYEGWKFILDDVHKTRTALEQKAETSVPPLPRNSSADVQPAAISPS